MNATTTLAELAVVHPAPPGLPQPVDFCCGGPQPGRRLPGAAARSGHHPRRHRGRGSAGRGPPRWDEAPLPSLVSHIVTTYHQRLRAALPELVAMARKVEQRHGDKASCPRGLAAALEAMHESLLDHLRKEEEILFPLIVSGLGTQAAAPVHVMEIEHEHHREHLLALRSLTDDLTPPAEACTTWRALYLGLQQLEQELMEPSSREQRPLPSGAGRVTGHTTG
jgi:regulator of cell morphogenesis and NO signaling